MYEETNGMKQAIIVLGHGSRRVEANSELETILALLAERHPDWAMQKAYAEFAEPSLEEAVALLAERGVKRIILMPFFLTVGNHLHKNLPNRLGELKKLYPELVITEAKHLGADLLLVQLIEKRIAEAEDIKGVYPVAEHQIKLNHLEQLPEVLEKIEGTLIGLDIPMEKKLDIRLCVSEAVGNALIHGNGRDQEKWVSVCWQPSFGELFLMVTDEGKGLAEEKRSSQELDPLRLLEESGKGLFLIYQLADTVCYNDCGNQITIRLTW